MITVANGETVPKDNLYPVGNPPPLLQLKVTFIGILVEAIAGNGFVAGLGGCPMTNGETSNLTIGLLYVADKELGWL